MPSARELIRKVTFDGASLSISFLDVLHLGTSCHNFNIQPRFLVSRIAFCRSLFACSHTTCPWVLESMWRRFNEFSCSLSFKLFALFSSLWNCPSVQCYLGVKVIFACVRFARGCASTLKINSKSFFCQYPCVKSTATFEESIAPNWLSSLMVSFGLDPMAVLFPWHCAKEYSLTWKSDEIASLVIGDR